MKWVNDYIINHHANAIINHYDEYGNLCSIVLEKEKIVYVNKSPLSIIEKSIEYYGHNLSGAIAGAKNVLRKVSMPPIKISGKLGLYWFPSKATSHQDCLWFSVNHIYDYYSVDRNLLHVILRDGYEITIPMNFERFDKKVGRGFRYKFTMETRAMVLQANSQSQIQRIQIVRDPERNHYTIIEQRQDEDVEQ